ncbi:MAG: alpha amylase C-terminal domain-containing protein [Bacteroidales bacterium]
MAQNALRLIQQDPWLSPFAETIGKRRQKTREKHAELCGSGRLHDFANGHLYFGLHREETEWVIREWAPHASEIWLLGECNGWNPAEEYRFRALKDGVWELRLQEERLRHEERFKLRIRWPEGEGDRIPAWCTRTVQDPKTKGFDAQVWAPGEPFRWNHQPPALEDFQPLVYEAHIGMATEELRLGTYDEFRTRVLPHIHRQGYNTVQIMAVQEHPYYGSFGYHVSSLFAASSRFGTPEDLKRLIDEAHGLGMAVIMDIVHSHAVKNELEGLGRFAGDPGQYFHTDQRRNHVAWDSLCYDYGKNEVLHFLLSNVQYWMTEYRFDGFRFDGVTSMLYYDHGLGRDFTSYDFYFDGGQDEDAITYLSLANELIQEIRPGGISIAEDMSGYPGLAAPLEDGGVGFNYRLAMGTPDYWIKTIKERSDETWNMEEIYRELTSKRADEMTIGYAESHDQALVGDKTIIFRLIDKDMYWHMNKGSENLNIDRGMALHKMIRLITAATAGNGYLNFMGNEFGHPEWIDFPRAGNDWSYQYARGQWSLIQNPDLRYHFLSDFDRDMVALIHSHRLYARTPEHVKTDQGDLVIAFVRSHLLFVFNFHPERSYTDYGLAVDAGKYRVVLSSDDPAYGGFARVDGTQVHRSQVERSFGFKHRLSLYLPSRSALVMHHLPTARVR